MKTDNLISLRGLAILLVVLFHLKKELFRFGFIGVDIFFVLSAFLITKSIEEKGYKLNNYLYYLEKRFFRIFPPLIAVSVITTIFSYILLEPNSLLFYAKSLIYTLIGLGDLYFFKNINYFSPQSYHIPSISFWSLGVEIKFYIIMPLLLIVFKNRKILILFIILTILIYYLLINVNNNFFLFLLKVPHFISGSLLYYFTKEGHVLLDYFRHKKKKYIFFLTFTVLIIILIPTNFNSQLVSFVTIFLSIILILGSNSKVYNLLLNNFFFNNIGKVSYSLYLVHWPIIVFYTIFTKGLVSDKITFDYLDIIILISLIILFTYKIYFLYEIKFINNKFNNFKNAQLYIFVIFIFLFSTFVIYKNGIYQRLNLSSNNFILNYNNIDIKNEHVNRKIGEKSYAKFTDSNANNILILGDSYAGDIFRSLLTASPNKSITGVGKADIRLFDSFSQHCFLILTNPENIDNKSECNEKIKKIISNENFKNAKTIIISYRFDTSYRENWENNISSLKKIKNFTTFKNKNVILINRRLEYYHPLHSQTMTQILLFKLSKIISFVKTDSLENILNKEFAADEKKEINNFLKKTLANTDIIYFDITKLQLSNNLPILFNNKGEPLYLDTTSHFTTAGNLYFGNLLLKSVPFKTIIYK